jgi:hypothetical protein
MEDNDMGDNDMLTVFLLALLVAHGIALVFAALLFAVGCVHGD